MIKIFILLIVFIFLAFLLNINKNETFSNGQLRCGLVKGDSLGDGSGSSGSGSSGDGSGSSSGDGSGSSGSGSSGGSSADGSSDGAPSGVNTQRILETVDPELPECVGICINQHTYTKENTKDIFFPSQKDLGKIKSNQSNGDEVMATGCGECIQNFYEGLKKMTDKSNKCNYDK